MKSENKNIYEIPYDELLAEMPGIRKRLISAMNTLKKYFVKRDGVIEAMFAGACTGEPVLLMGAPGTAKSDLIIKFAETAGITTENYFEYMLTKFTEPNELLGPVDIEKLKTGDYFRKTQGKLPEAQIVFLDEIFKSNSAILNTLLTVLNEKKFYQNGVATPVKMSVFFGATNEIPAHNELSALKDRFLLKLPCHSVHESDLDSLLRIGVSNDIFRTFNEKPWANVCSISDFVKVKAFIERTISGLDGKQHENPFNYDKELYFSEVYPQFRAILTLIEKEMHVKLSDRKIIKFYKLLRTYGYLMHGGEVRASDLFLLRYSADTGESVAQINEKLVQRLS